MAIDQVDQTVVTTESRIAPAASLPTAPVTGPGGQIVQTERRRITTTSPGGSELIRRIAVLVFGLIQLVIGARIVLLLLDAREANAIVSWILNVSQVFVSPFEGILKTDALHAAGSVLDVTALVAFVGWAILEIVILWALGIFRREAV